ncbi:MAG: hypothetical protein GOVbin1709_52 [Prokaryotic dsDNA virus sp.]|nr:MAG: hypothetical protein GOVbin1709_52 [Prokaryotic dsDNA virus sp.]|tara:strand:+ start:5338 stop:5523 length:186 start_codon:yes stop_codon:yes gene_type:complete
MSKESAIEICKNLSKTITRMKRVVMDSPFDVPSAKKSTLKRKLINLMKKYNLKEEDLWTKI